MNRKPRPVDPRVGARAPQRRQFLVFTEGEKTETDYLRHYWRLHLESVTVTVDGFHGPPHLLVDRAVDTIRAEKRETRNGGGRPYDEVWCAFDRDQHPHIPATLDKARANGIGIAFSVPCIELWFILHFRDQQAHLEGDAAQAASFGLLGCEKALSSAALDQLAANYPEARRRAQALDVKHEGDDSPPHTNPSSTMWRLIDQIRGA